MSFKSKIGEVPIMENAILMASGLGTRMRPLTEKRPKPLIEVNGQPMIETIIEGLLRRDEVNLYIVVGYLGEQFKYLKTSIREFRS